MKFFRLFEMIRIFLILCILAYNFTASVIAVEIDDLYQARVPIVSQSSADRNRAIKQAMTAVLIKVSGKKNVESNPTFKQAIASPNSYFQQFRYQSNAEQNFLVVDFDENKINQLFKDANASIWGRFRPQVLVWVVQENNFSREILASTSSSSVVSSLVSTAKQRGLPLILPLMDLDDAQNLGVADVWGRFANPILKASERYFAEQVIVIRISNYSLVHQTSEQVNCGLLCQQDFVFDWSLVSENEQVTRRYQGKELSVLTEQAMDDITEHIHQQYALVTSNNNELLIDINNIDNLAKFAQALSFFQSLSSVETVTLISAKGEHRRFKLNFNGSKAALLASLKLSQQMTLFVDPLDDQSLIDIPVFSWQP